MAETVNKIRARIRSYPNTPGADGIKATLNLIANSIDGVVANDDDVKLAEFDVKALDEVNTVLTEAGLSDDMRRELINDARNLHNLNERMVTRAQSHSPQKSKPPREPTLSAPPAFVSGESVLRFITKGVLTIDDMKIFATKFGLILGKKITKKDDIADALKTHLEESDKKEEKVDLTGMKRTFRDHRQRLMLDEEKTLQMERAMHDIDRSASVMSPDAVLDEIERGEIFGDIKLPAAVHDAKDAIDSASDLARLEQIYDESPPDEDDEKAQQAEQAIDRAYSVASENVDKYRKVVYNVRKFISSLNTDQIKALRERPIAIDPSLEHKISMVIPEYMDLNELSRNIIRHVVADFGTNDLRAIVDYFEKTAVIQRYAAAPDEPRVDIKDAILDTPVASALRIGGPIAMAVVGAGSAYIASQGGAAAVYDTLQEEDKSEVPDQEQLDEQEDLEQQGRPDNVDVDEEPLELPLAGPEAVEDLDIEMRDPYPYGYDRDGRALHYDRENRLFDDVDIEDHWVDEYGNIRDHIDVEGYDIRGRALDYDDEYAEMDDGDDSYYGPLTQEDEEQKISEPAEEVDTDGKYLATIRRVTASGVTLKNIIETRAESNEDHRLIKYYNKERNAVRINRNKVNRYARQERRMRTGDISSSRELALWKQEKSYNSGSGKLNPAYDYRWSLKELIPRIDRNYMQDFRFHTPDYSQRLKRIDVF